MNVYKTYMYINVAIDTAYTSQQTHSVYVYICERFSRQSAKLWVSGFVRVQVILWTVVNVEVMVSV